MTTGSYTLHHLLHSADLVKDAQTLSRLARALRDGLGRRVPGTGAAKPGLVGRPVGEAHNEAPSIERTVER